MKTTKFLVLITVLLIGVQSKVSAESYQRWITWTNDASHSLTVSEMVDIMAALDKKEISSSGNYRLSTGATYSIPQPDLYLSYLVSCIKVAEPSVVTAGDAINVLLKKGNKVKWGNDISCYVRNYFFSSLHNKVQYNDNYSGASEAIDVIIINGIPVVKCDCGNPLGGINVVVVQAPPPAPPSNFTQPKQENWTFEAPKTREVNLNLPPTRTIVYVKDNNKLLWWLAGVAATSVVVTAVCLLTKEHHHGEPAPAPSYPADEGGPAGAPSYPAVTNTGGPNGSPTYGFNPAVNRLSESRLSLKMSFDDVNGLTGTKINFAPKRSYAVGVVFKF